MKHEAKHPQERPVVAPEPKTGKGPGTKFSRPDATPRVKRHDAMDGAAQRSSLANPNGLQWAGARFN